MKTLKKHILLYDSECPMCDLYSRGFVASGMLDGDGRTAYQEVLGGDGPESCHTGPGTLQVGNVGAGCPLIDRQRAVNEIALVDTTTGAVSYGIDSLFKVIGYSFPVLRPLFRWRPFTWLMRKLYSFISYNRKVIIPAPVPDSASLQPSFSLRYRLAWLLFTALISGSILTRYARLLPGLVSAGGAYREYLICAGQIVFQGLMVALTGHSRRTFWDYLGNMMTISLAGSLLLLPALAAHSILTPTLAALYFLLVAACMLAEHIRRTRLLRLGWGLSVSWAGYRMVLLLLILL
jgi:hypothetical protein